MQKNKKAKNEKIPAGVTKVINHIFKTTDSATKGKISLLNAGFLNQIYLYKHNNKKQIVVKVFNQNKSIANELPEDILHGYLVSERANNLAQANPKVLGVYSVTQKQVTKIPNNYNEDIDFVQIQEFLDAKPFDDIFVPTISGELSNSDKQNLNKIVKLIASVHKKKIKGVRARSIYNRSIRDVLCHPELGFSVLQNNLQESQFFSGEFKYQYITEMIKVIDFLSNNEKRLSSIHGDFWENNILFDQKIKIEPKFIDYSRMCHGEPGIDIGWFYSSMIWRSVGSGSAYHSNIANYFLEQYKKVSGDKEIEKFMLSSIGFIGLIAGIEKFTPNVDNLTRKKFIDWIYSCLRDKQLSQLK